MRTKATILKYIESSNLDKTNPSYEELIRIVDAYYSKRIKTRLLKTSLPFVVFTVGMPGSGKSTWSKKFAELIKNTTVVSADKLRINLTGDINNKTLDDTIYKTMVENTIKILKLGCNVVIDTTNLTRARRELFYSAIQEYNREIKMFYQLFPSTVETSFARITNQLQSGEVRALVTKERLVVHKQLYKETVGRLKSKEPITKLPLNLLENYT